MDADNSDEKDDVQSADGFILHTGDARPESLLHTQGAIVRLRSGELALFPPAATDVIVDLIHYWQQLDDLDDHESEPAGFTDIVAYKPLPVTIGDDLARAALHILRFVSTSLPENTLLGGRVAQSIHQFGVAQARKRVLDAVEAYARSWPDDAALKSLRRLGRWGADLRLEDNEGDR